MILNSKNPTAKDIVNLNGQIDTWLIDIKIFQASSEIQLLLSDLLYV